MMLVHIQIAADGGVTSTVSEWAKGGSVHKEPKPLYLKDSNVGEVQREIVDGV